MNKMMFISLGLLVLDVSASLVFGQTLSVPWHSIGPAGRSAGGVYSLSGSVAPGAGNMSGGNFSLSGGFWPAIGGQGVAPTNGVGFCSNQITGTIRFNNSNPAILSLLNPPGNEGLTTFNIYFDSVPPGRSGNSGSHPATGLTSSDYQVTVDADCTNAAGISYVVTPYVSLGTGAEEAYYFAPKTSPPVVAGLAGPIVNFEECLGVIELNFVDSQGVPLSVNGGYIYADSYNEILWDIPDGATQQRLYVRGGDQAHPMAIALYRGTNIYTDRLTYYLNTNFTVACDTILDVNIVIPDAGALGQITGTVDMLREFEWTVPSEFPGYYQDLTGVTADYGPFANKRWTALYGDNATIPSSGTFQLINLVPSTADPASPGYAVQGKMLIRTNRMVESFWTPGLGWGNNPAVVVTPGATVDLGNIFQIDPGYVRGAIQLKGPAETPGHLSMLRGILHCGDYDANHDGIPDRIGGNNGVYYSYIEYDGVDRRATGAQYTAAGGYGWGDFDGSFDGASSSFLGHSELALGGLQGERSLWHPDYFVLWLENAGWTGVGDDYDGYLEINDRSSRQIEVVPGQPVTNDVAYGFSEVIVRIYSPSGNFTRPSVVFQGGLTGTNFLGQQANYYVQYDIAHGTPYYQPTNLAQVRVLVPEGVYTLNPYVQVNGGNIGLTPFELTLGAGQRLDLGNCLRLDLVIPTQVTSNQLSLAGSVLTGCNNSVLDITYQLNGAAPVTVCNNCGASPTFNFSVPLLVGANELAVTARDDQGAVSSISGAIQVDLPAFVLRITSVVRSGNDLQLEFTSQSGHTYNVLSTLDLSAGTWSLLQTGIAGNGGVVQVTVANAFNQPQQFFRLQQAQ
jgi:hypothetical protein